MPASRPRTPETSDGTPPSGDYEAWLQTEDGRTFAVWRGNAERVVQEVSRRNEAWDAAVQHDQDAAAEAAGAPRRASRTRRNTLLAVGVPLALVGFLLAVVISDGSDMRLVGILAFTAGAVLIVLARREGRTVQRIEQELARRRRADAHLASLRARRGRAYWSPMNRWESNALVAAALSTIREAPASLPAPGDLPDLSGILETWPADDLGDGSPRRALESFSRPAGPSDAGSPAAGSSPRP